MKYRIIASSFYMIVGFILFAVVFIFGLIALLSVLFGSLSSHSAESIGQFSIGENYNLSVLFPFCLNDTVRAIVVSLRKQV